MSDLAAILSDLADALELERELGTRVVEIDRELLTAPAKTTSVRQQEGEAPVDAASSPRPTEVVRQETRDATAGQGKTGQGSRSRSTAGDLSSEKGEAQRGSDVHVACQRTNPTSVDLASRPRPSLLPLVFLHDKALSPGGVEMMAKIVTALKLSPETSPILFTGTRPAARVTVVLGGRALKKWFPGAAGAPGQWISPNGASNVLVTYSPEYILRFGTVTPAVKKLKLDMWNSLKAAYQRAVS